MALRQNGLQNDSIILHSHQQGMNVPFSQIFICLYEYAHPKTCDKVTCFNLHFPNWASFILFIGYVYTYLMQ